MSLILDLVFPRRCYSCGQLGHYFCPLCRQQLVPKALVPDPKGVFEGIIALFPYNGPILNAVHDLKYRFVTDLAPEIANLICTSLRSHFPNILTYWQQQAFVLTPIPLHPWRQNWRGFNQSEIVASLVAKNLDLDFIPNLLLRTRLHQTQVHTSSKSLRLQNVSSDFALNPNINLPKKIIIFDDVTTTGATLQSSASCLSVADYLWGLTFAG